MPIMTLNQAKMILQIAAATGGRLPPSASRSLLPWWAAVLHVARWRVNW
ncbi:MAG: hypothetical protein ACLTQI_03500 [Slackia sp.]